MTSKTDDRHNFHTGTLGFVKEEENADADPSIYVEEDDDEVI